MTIRKQLLKLMRQPDYQPLKRQQLAAALNLPDDATTDLNSNLRELANDGLVVKLKKSVYALADRADLLEGTIAFTKGGSAFVDLEDDDGSIFVNSRNTGTALPGDAVLVRLRSSNARRQPGRQPEGKVVRVLERRTRTLVGVLKRQHRLWYVEPMQSTISHDVAVPDPEGAQLGDRVLVQLAAWDDPHVSPEGEIIEVIGPADDPAGDTLAVMKNFELDPAFPPDVVAEAEQCTLTDADYRNRDDLRNVFTFTIDPATARDFDDAISLERRGRHWRLMVHIADVSHYVSPGTALNREAARRATSVYLVDQVVPMLPEQLSNGLCSLNPKVDRLAFTAILTLDDNGHVRNSSFARTVINSNVRLTYEEAMEIISGDQKSYARHGLTAARTDRIRRAHKLAQALRRRRLREEGALNMELPEVRFTLGDDGRIADVNPVSHDESHQLIEEFMLLANECVARELSSRGVAHVHRIHDAPDPERLVELADRFVAAGIPVGDLVNRRNLVKLLDQIADMPQRHAWNTAVLRAMRKAEYSIKPIGHYGLNKQFYDHFTSPIRRYPDLLNHRILGALIAGERPAYNTRELIDLCRHCSERERNAMEAERELIALKRLRFFADQLADGKPVTYRAIITEVRHFGIMIEVVKVQAIGLIPLNLLSDDFYRFDSGCLELRGADTGRTFRVGDELPVQIARVDFDKKFLDFMPAELDEPDAKKNRGRRRSGKGKRNRDDAGKPKDDSRKGRRRNRRR